MIRLVFAFLWIAALGGVNQTASAQTAITCPSATITEFLGGPKHGSMMLVRDSSADTSICRDGVWLCLDPGAAIMTREESDRLFSLVLTFHSLNKPVSVSFYPEVVAAECGPQFPVVHDLRGDLNRR